MDSGDSSSYLVASKLETTIKDAADTANTRVIEEEAEGVYEDIIPVDQIQPLIPFENRTAEAVTDWINEDDNAHVNFYASHMLSLNGTNKPYSIL
jgi:hypothetical protein